MLPLTWNIHYIQALVQNDDLKIFLLYQNQPMTPCTTNANFRVNLTIVFSLKSTEPCSSVKDADYYLDKSRLMKEIWKSTKRPNVLNAGAVLWCQEVAQKC